MGRLPNESQKCYQCERGGVASTSSSTNLLEPQAQTGCVQLLNIQSFKLNSIPKLQVESACLQNSTHSYY